MRKRAERVVLGIDAAWTAHHPSGVAVAVEAEGGWRLVALAPSYRAFHAMAGSTDEGGDVGKPIAADLLRSAERVAGRPVDLVAIDMPLALHPITGRRPSDIAVSRAYARHWCATHSPSSARPGPISDALTAGFAAAGYPLLTEAIDRAGVIEVYPHPALVELARATKRLEYKAQKTRNYWPAASPAERRIRLAAQWQLISRLLSAEIAGIDDLLPELDPTAPMATLKSYEDQLDAVVCAVVAIGALEGKAMPFGDAQSAIWIPKRPDLAREASLL